MNSNRKKSSEQPVKKKQGNRCPKCNSSKVAVSPGKKTHVTHITCLDCNHRFTLYFFKRKSGSQLKRKHSDYKLRIERLLRKPLAGWDKIFIRDLYRKWEACNRDGKTLKLSPKQIAHLTKIEQGGDR